MYVIHKSNQWLVTILFILLGFSFLCHQTTLFYINNYIVYIRIFHIFKAFTLCK